MPLQRFLTQIEHALEPVRHVMKPILSDPLTIMEIAAIGTDLLIASQAHISDLLFWGALAFSLSVGFVFAYPVNAVLVYVGVKEGMKNPAEMGQSQSSGQAQAAD